MPRIRKLQYGGASRKLGDCFRVLLLGAAGECLAGELGCCGDSCCSSAVVSRALAEYCQHSDAAREAFVAAKGLDALQVALTRGSPSVATAAARVLGALCSSSHGLHCVLRWQSSGRGGGDLLSTVAAVAGQVELPPDLRVECVDALRCLLGSLHGPAGGGGMDLAGALQAALKSGVGVPGGGGCGIALAADNFLTHVALPALLSHNAHLRAAAARLVAAAAEEGVLAVAAAATSLSEALHLAHARSGRDDGGAEVHESLSGAAVCGGSGGGSRSGGGSGAGLDRMPRNWRVLALCELVAALLGSSTGAELLVALRAPAHVLALCREVLTVPEGGAGDGCPCLNCNSGGDLAGIREALLDAVLLCAREGQYKLWMGTDEAYQREKRVFVAGAARLAALLLRPSLAFSSTATMPGADIHAAAQGSYAASGGSLLGLQTLPSACALASTAAALASALTAWPTEVIHHQELAEPLYGLLRGLSDSAVTLLRSGQRGVGRGAITDEASTDITWQQLRSRQAARADQDRDPGWPEVPPHGNLFSWELGNGGGREGRFGWHSRSGSNALDEASNRLRVVAAAAAAAIRLYGAVYGRDAQVSATSSVASVAGEEELQNNRSCDEVNEESAAAAAVAQCLGRVLEASHDGNRAVTMLTPPMEALLELPPVLLDCLAAASTTTTSHGYANNGGRGFSLVDLGLAAARLAEHVLQELTTNLSRLDVSSGWSAGCDWRVSDNKPALKSHAHHKCLGGFADRCSSDLHTALQLWGRKMKFHPNCTCGLQVECVEFGSEPAAVSCDACNLRPVGSISGFVEMTEQVMSLRECGSRVRKLLQALICNIQAGVSGVPDRLFCPKGSSELWNQLHARAVRLWCLPCSVDGVSAERQGCSTVAPGHLQEVDGTREHEVLRDSEMWEVDQAVDLADADSILDDCLACIGAELTVS